jgi:hypothetical protein
MKKRSHTVCIILFLLLTFAHSLSLGCQIENPGTDDGKNMAGWKIPATASLLTKWGRDVSPEKVHAEYPRPQMVRTEWMSLNGLREYAPAKSDENPPFGKRLDGKILVPFPIESALSGVMKSAERLWYRCVFKMPKKWAGKRILLHFGAVDWEATVFVNGRPIGEHRGGYDPFSFDVTEAIKKGSSQELIVGVYDPSDAGEQPRGKQVRKPSGIWYTPSTGIWQTVWLEPVPKDYILNLVMVPDVDAKCLRLTMTTTGNTEEQRVRATVLDAGKEVAIATARAGSELAVPLSSPQLWSPSAPFLYDLSVELFHGNKKVDRVMSYFGMRKVEIAEDERGINRIFLNGKFLMQVGPLDQGFWPDGLYTAPSDEAARYDIELTKKLGFNMTRKHVKVEHERWYYWADKLGLLVWQDMPSANSKTPESRKQFELELERLVRTHQNHPSIIMWVVFNEGWGQYDTERLTAWVKQMDPSRLVNNASGWDDKKAGDIRDIHSYPAPKAPEAEPNRAIVLGEFGGLGLAIDGHTWKKEHWGYQGMYSADHLTSRYETFLRNIFQSRDKPGLCAAVYTQLTDVEVECNGLMTYDRAIVKPDMERVAAANQGDFSRVPPPPVVEIVVPTSEEQGQKWSYTLEQPSADWFKTEFDHSQWKVGPGGFGTKGTPGSVVRTEWSTAEIWLRRSVTIPDKKLASLQFRIHHDEDAEVYVNGVLAGRFSGYSTGYEENPIAAQGLDALRPGENMVAVHCKQTAGGQYIDLGMIDVVPSSSNR